MKGPLFLLFACCSAVLSGAVDLRPEEYSWDNPEFRDRFTATYGVLGEVEPPVDPAEREFLRERVLPEIGSDPEEARRRVEERLAETSSPVLRFLLGNLCLELGDLEAARENLERAIRRFPDFRRAHRSLALLETREGNFGASIPRWREVLRLGGGDDQSYGLLGYAYLQEGRWTAAARALESALVHRPESRDLRRGLVQAYLQTDRPGQAAELIRGLLAEDPADPQLWRFLANHHLRRDELPRTAAALEVAIRLGEPAPDTILLLGNVYASLGLPGEALAAYERLFGLPPSDLAFADAYRPLELLLRQRRWSEAERFGAGLRNYFGRDLDSRQAGRIDAGIAVARLHLDPSPALAGEVAAHAEERPLDGLLRLALGDYYADNDRIPEALLAYRRAAATEDHRYEATLRLANLLVAERRYDEAVKRLRELQEIRYSDRVARFLARLSDLEGPGAR